MIIDLILDRKDGQQYNARDFYFEICEYEQIFNFPGVNISGAFEYGTEADAKKQLCKYITTQGYNTDICDYINSVNWLPDA